MPRVVHFEINVDDAERAAQFYTKLFGWKIERWDGAQDYWLITTGESSEVGIDGALMPRMNPTAGVINTIDVPSVDDVLRDLAIYGGKVVMPKTVIPAVGFVAYCKDSEGNLFGIMQRDQSAH